LGRRGAVPFMNAIETANYRFCRRACVHLGVIATSPLGSAGCTVRVAVGNPR
jgi:hypothetical protein